MKECRGNSKKVSMSDCFYVPENSENLLSVSKLTRGGAKVVFGEKSLIEQGNGMFIHLLSEEIFSFGNHKQLSFENVENNSSVFTVNKTYFCSETWEKTENFSEKKENMIKDDDIGKKVELENEHRAHPKTRTSSDERGKEEWRNLCEVEKFQSIDMKWGSRLGESIKFESRAGKLIKIFDLGQKKKWYCSSQTPCGTW